MLQTDTFLSQQQMADLRRHTTCERTRVEENVERHGDGRADWLPFLQAVRHMDLPRCQALYEEGRKHPMRHMAIPYGVMVLAQVHTPLTSAQERTRLLLTWLWDMHVEMQKEACPWRKIRHQRDRWKRFVWGAPIPLRHWTLPLAREIRILTRWLEWAKEGHNATLQEDLQQRLNQAQRARQAETF